MKRILRISGVMLFVTVVGVLLAEKIDIPAKGLYKIATNVVVGKVNDIYTKKEKKGDYLYTRYLAEVRLLACEKGEGLEVGDLVYIRYWRKIWQGSIFVRLPPGTAGHRGLPEESDILRIYLARNAYDGFTHENKDGSFNVIGANGFERLSPEEKEKYMHEEGKEEGKGKQ